MPNTSKRGLVFGAALSAAAMGVAAGGNAPSDPVRTFIESHQINLTMVSLEALGTVQDSALARAVHQVMERSTAVRSGAPQASFAFNNMPF
jgi:FXSXX-COOH protein